MTTRALTHLPIPSGSAGIDALLPALRLALAGDGPALALTPDGDTASAYSQRLTAALAPDEPLESDDIALVIATSGSTGTPHGVLLSDRVLLEAADRSLARLGGPGHWVATMPLHHIGGVMTVVRALRVGLEVTADPSLGGETRFEPAAFAATTQDAVSRARADGVSLYTSLVPTQLARLAAEPTGMRALTAYDAVLQGAAACPPDLLTLLRESGVNLVVSFGMTETTGGCVYDGVAFDGTTVSLVDVADDVGRIVLGGSLVAQGYRRLPELTAELFGADGFRTSDLGRIGPGGVLEVVGRIDDVVHVGGVNVSVLAVQNAIRALDGVDDVAVVPLADAEWGARLIACVAVGTSRPVGLAEEARLLVASSLGRRAVPEVRLLDELPMLSSGKVDRAALRDFVSSADGL